MEAHTIRYAKNCPVYQQQKHPTKKDGEIPYRPSSTFLGKSVKSISFKDKDSNEQKLQALSVIDVATCWPEIIPLHQ
jgi:hypothetical protein